MKKLILIALSFTMIFAQQGKYVRKSVSSLESVWFKPGSIEMEFDQATFNKFMSFYIEIDRFDYNVLPSSYIKDFIGQANALETISSDSLSKVLEVTVVEKILAILNQPDVMKARGGALKSEASLQSFAATKAKSLGLTTEELETLLNSAYIYLPYITKASKSIDKKGNLTADIGGGLIWWKVNVQNDGSTSVAEILSATTSGISTINPNKKNTMTGAPSTFKFGNDSWETSADQWVQNDAMLAFAKNLGVKTKEIDDFKLSAQIAEVGQNNSYSFPLGRKEGVFLDDGFFIVEYEENAEGEEIKVEKGFIRISKTGKNVDDPTAYSQAIQLLGSPVTEGSIVLEHPRLGMDGRFTMGMVAGSSILPYHTFDILSEESTSLLVGNLSFAYNVAPIIGLSQTFLNLDVGFGLPIAKYTEGSDAVAYVVTSYLGASKRFGGQTFFGGGAAVGLDMLRMSYTSYGQVQTLEFSNFGAKIFGEAGYMLNADLSIIGTIGYKMGFAKDFDDLELGGLLIDVGASYSLGELPINIFGFLDPYKKY